MKNIIIGGQRDGMRVAGLYCLTRFNREEVGSMPASEVLRV